MKQQELGVKGKPWLTEEFCSGVERDGAGNLYLAVSPLSWIRYPEELDVLVQKVSSILFCPANDRAPNIAARRASWQELRGRLWANPGLGGQNFLAVEDKTLALAGHSEFVKIKNEFWQTVKDVKVALAFDSKHEIVRDGATSRRQKIFLRQNWRANIAKLESLPPLAIFSWTVWAAERLKGIVGPRPASVRPDRVAKTLKDILREFARQESRRRVDQLIVVAEVGCLSEARMKKLIVHEVEKLDRELRAAGVELPPFFYGHLNLTGRLKAFKKSF